jgi:catechol 2,3-dioxygenase-like lactoylglutathione lyase family enzyme
LGVQPDFRAIVEPEDFTMTETLKLKSAGPGLTVNDLQASIAFYRDALGFEVGERWEDGGELRGVEMTAGSVAFMLSQDDWKKGRNRDKGQGVRIFCATDQDVDRIAERARAAGATLEHEPRDEWGMRAFALADPDGYRLTIARELPK